MRPEELADRIGGRAFAEAKVKLMQKVVLTALRHSQELTPVRTGTLRRSETTRVEDGGARGFIGSNVVYAPFVHERVPFFAEGIEEASPEIEQLLQDMGDQFWGAIAR